ncbi:FixH family protein [Paenibacillus allorhizosphaerae]|uniref:YtkA-like domain-containing protein n=1 Tax=Paenibacillus allorhizosphaerae TaxID=2849866 RepID=A0ABM8VAC2_9BACL|nr:FixH family protein [Paenibacillus allorhizosphaerae]CAG7615913.1 hypothetical protein PAECIP111802_00226 [Paenibacillus allorhizosphaerae]
MMKKSLPFIALVTFLLAAACSNSTTETAVHSGAVQVEIKPVQETLHSGKAILIDALVTKGSEKVTDAGQVKFEIWKKDQEKRKTITAGHSHDGKYRIQTMFPEAGVYYVTAEVSDKETYVTPIKELVVKNVTDK